MPRARVKPPGKKGPKDFEARLKQMKTKQPLSPDRKDYQRTIAGRGDTHALDGGKIPFSKTARGKAFREKHQNKIQSWQDRNVMNRGTKLNP